MNENFAASFEMEFTQSYFTVSGAGDYVNILPTALPLSLQGDLPFFIFGHNDFASGYARLKNAFPLPPLWNYGRPFIFGRDENDLTNDVDVIGTLRDGDMVIPYFAIVGAQNYAAVLVVRCTTQAYGSILESLSSDDFVVGHLRISLSDNANIRQFTKQITWQNLSIFGKNSSDQISPQSYKSSRQFQDGIVDMPVEYKVDKYISFGFYNLFTNTSMSWSIFVSQLSKLT